LPEQYASKMIFLVQRKRIDDRPTEFRRKAGGVSPKSRWSFAERPMEFRRKADAVSETDGKGTIIKGEKARFRRWRKKEKAFLLR
jgi:hypothetical protein